MYWVCALASMHVIFILLAFRSNVASKIAFVKMSPDTKILRKIMTSWNLQNLCQFRQKNPSVPLSWRAGFYAQWLMDLAGSLPYPLFINNFALSAVCFRNTISVPGPPVIIGKTEVFILYFEHTLNHNLQQYANDLSWVQSYR